MPEYLTEDRSITLRTAHASADKDILLNLRDQVYVRDQGRLGDAHDTALTFDRFDPYAEYIIAEESTDSGIGPVGTVKIVADSEIGLPVDEMVDVGHLRQSGHRLVEFGHLMTIPRVRNRHIGLQLMRAALIHSLVRFRATHVLGDFFAEADGSLRTFYRQLGFVQVGSSYQDQRFKGGPLSVTGVLDLADAAERARTAGDQQDATSLLHYFFHDYDSHRA
ncbi:N-acyl amino acid synthase FeeM domain-containing protein [Streptomyces sp. NBC_01518]|uniref:N-acyl amino acid synthase FeeM domain-containing protein n=1 Tax=Streptomyces sp. NBC_01518 TaxID=2903891 RepID=UPI0038698F42